MTPSKERALMKQMTSMVEALLETRDKVDNRQTEQISKLKRQMKEHLKSHEDAAAKE